MTTHHCKVCGEAVDPSEDVLFGALGRPLFAAHSGVCADQVRKGAKFAFDVTTTLLQKKAPDAVRVFGSLVTLAKQLRGSHG